MVALTVLMPTESGGGWLTLAPICLALVAIGMGVGLAWPHLLTRVFHVAPDGEQDLASASITTVQLFATALGAALAGMSAAVGQKAIIFAPKSAPQAKVAQLLVFGAKVILVDGTYDDAFDLTIKASNEFSKPASLRFTGTERSR